MLRETALAELLPREVGYPEVLASGVEDGHEWMASRRLPGSNLAEAWQSLSEPDQNRAVLGLWDRLEAVHRTDIRAALAIGCDRTPLYELERAGATYQLHAAVAAGVLRIDDEIRLAAILDVAFDAIRLIERCLCHTDAGRQNSLWDRSNTTLLDFECACVGPADLDLENVFNDLFDFGSSSSTSQLLEAVRPILARGGATERLRGYMILRELSVLHLLIRNHPNRDDFETWEPSIALQGIIQHKSWIDQI